MDRYEFTADQRKLLEGLSQPLGIFQFIDKRVVTVLLSDGFREIFGYKDLEQAYFDMDNNMYKYTHPDDVARISEAALRFATEGGTYEVIYRTRNRNSDDYRIIHAMGKHVYTDDGARLSHVWYVDEGAYAGEDGSPRTELNRAFNEALREESIARESNYDYLTGLPSMTYFFDLATEGKRLLRDKGEEPVLLYMDMNGMKYFNMQYGFGEGDNLLREFAMVLKSTFSDRNCCRIGADHFAAYTTEVGLEDKLQQFLQACGDINNGRNLPVRIGVYSNRMGDVTASTACDRAKFACDALHSSYGSHFNYFDRSLRDDEERRLYVLTNLDRAIEEGWIQVHYQMIVRTVNSKVCEEEALARWFDPSFGPLSPADFVPALEDAGTIYKLDLYVLEQVLQKMKRQGEAGLSIVPCSINLSRSDFTACDIVQEIAERVDAAGMDRSKIAIEITESIVGSDRSFMKEQVARFRNLGFPVWMDDFGSGYSSIDLLQSMEFDLIKFDMSFLRQLEKGDGGRVVLTELVKMATALGFDTLCEGVETEEQVQFLSEIGCSKLQGFYFCKPIPFEGILERYEKGIQLGFENPEESAYYDAVGRVSLFDLTAIAGEEATALQGFVSTLPICVVELADDSLKYLRTNQSYRDFTRRFFALDLKDTAPDDFPTDVDAMANSAFIRAVKQCCATESRVFFDESMPDGSIVHSLVRYIGANSVTGKKSAVVVVLSISEPDEGATYASIARALAADYYNIYYVDLDTEDFIEYSSQIGGDQLAMERHGKGFFEAARNDTMTLIHEKDRRKLLARFTKENVIRDLDEQGVFTATYRLVEGDKSVYAHMKITRLYAGANQIIVGVSIIDSQMRQQELFDKMQREHDVLVRIMALSGDYLSIYAIDPETDRYFESNVTSEFESLGFAKGGEDFFQQALVDAPQIVCPEDLPGFLEWLTKENIMNKIAEHGATVYHYRLMMPDGLKPVSLRIAKVQESDGVKLIAGIRAWRQRQPSGGSDA